MHGVGATWWSAHSLVRIKIKPPRDARLEIGSGPRRRTGWVTLDMSRGADVYWDLRRPLPFDDAMFKCVYCSHVLEHFSYPELTRLLGEVLRVLRPGGEFLITVPDASIYIDAYRGTRPLSPLLRYEPAVISHKPMDGLNYLFYMDGHHRFMFDAENLAFHCEAAGFTRCLRRAFDPEIDSIDRDYESLYMSCRKRGD